MTLWPKRFSFRNHSATRPNTPQPGDELDTAFADGRAAVDGLEKRLSDIRRSDGALKDGIVTRASLAPDITTDLAAKANSQASLLATAAQAAAAQSQVDAQAARTAASAAAADAQTARSSAASVLANAPNALQKIADAGAAADTAVRLANGLASQVQNDASQAHGDAGRAGQYADLSYLWAEYMGLPDGSPSGDQKIPPNKLSLMGITGDHWSSRWWANRASNAFGKLTELYLGVHPDHATATASSTSQPPAAGAIYYNSTDNHPYVWGGSGWSPFWQPQAALQTSLFYKVAAAAQSDFVLGTADLFGQSFTLDKQDTEPLAVHVNGVLLFPGQAAKAATALGPAVPAVAGDYLVDAVNNKIVVSQALAVGSVVTIDVLTPRDKFATGSVNFHSLLSFDLDPVSKAPGQIDGSRKQFVLTRVDGKAVTVGSAEEVFLSLDGVIQQPGVDYNIVGSRLTFTGPPRVGSNVWALWMEPSASGGSGKGVNPPAPPDDLHINRLGWSPGNGIQWDDDRGDMHSVANAAARLALKDPEQIIPGSMVYERDTHDIWVYTPAGVAGSGPAAVGGTGTTSATGSTSSAPVAAGDPKLTTNWTMALKGHPTDNILRALEYDPSRPNSMAWEDNRDEMETVNAEADLSNRTVLPASHLAVGKLVYVRATGQLWECIVDGTTGTITNTIADFKPLGGAGVTFVGRIGNLPDPAAKTIPDGSLFMVNLDLLGKEYHRLYVFDAQGVNAAGVVGVYRTCSTKDFIKALRSDPDQGLDAEPGDIQMTLENGHKEIKAVDATSAWQVVYSEDQVKSWIAASNLFQGTVEEPGHGTKGAIDLDKLPAETALGITDAGHYFVWVGTSGHIIGATEVGGAASAIAGARLSVGDWLVAANTGTAAAPVMKWTHIPGDLLSKGRGDGLYGLNNWVAGAYEQGSLVCFNGDIYKASQPVLATDIAPGATPTTPGATNPWAKVNISGGVKTVASDTNLPAGAANGAVYLVLSSAQAGGKGAMYMWDQAAAKWQSLGGGGVPMSLSGGKKLINYGSPIGSVIAFAGKVMPAGYKLCDGSTFDQTTFPELFKVLGNSNILPDLRDQFIRGANTLADVSFVKHDATTGMPKNHFTGVSNSSGSHTHTTDNPGDHRHNVGFSMSNHNWKGGGGWTGDATCNFSQDGGAASSANGGHTHTTTSNGAHTHSIEINSGGDPEGTAPKHVVLCYIIKVDDVGIRHAS